MAVICLKYSAQISKNLQNFLVFRVFYLFGLILSIFNNFTAVTIVKSVKNPGQKTKQKRTKMGLYSNREFYCSDAKSFADYRLI